MTAPDQQQVVADALAELEAMAQQQSKAHNVDTAVGIRYAADHIRAAIAASNAGTDRADRERVAETLYRMNGRAWYGRDLGRWDDPGSRISGDEYEKDRWRRQADHLMGVRA